MDIHFTPDELAFREEVRSFLREKLPASLAAKVKLGKRQSKADICGWMNTLNARGWYANGWPVELGGTGWSVIQKHIFDEECARVGAPRVLPFGVVMVGPVIIKFGTPEQKAHFLPRILDGTDWWAQGYSESADELGSLAVAKLLKAVADKEQPQLVILGKQAIDSDNNQTGQMLAALSGYAQGTFASKVEVAGDKINVTREVDGGLQTVALNLPAIVTTDLRLNEPRYASLPNIMKAKKKPLETVTPQALGVSTASTVSTLNVEAPATRSAGIKVKSVAELVEKLKNEAKVI
ncbi:acyl-CoA dehydrogenase family protein [Pseudomonas sp. P66]|uniref:Electron transfer flavoprotein small subunit n=1 Tax=Pseudomonas arcuscaelestis TaxID=2710591 RepID=A0ABS2BVV1_9PSED|nr:acyl-CoA dehydrogenase family protein [Pseudomonas arcuscaelestis]